jgi:O-antigen/teichoic acid export membrane protein
MDIDSLSYKTLKNSSYTFITYVFPIVFSIFVIPVVVKRLGYTDYGVYVLVNTIIGFLGLLDLGLSTALIKYISEYHARAEFVKLQTLIRSVNSMFLIIGIVSFLVFLLVGAFFLPAFHISLGSEKHIFTVFLLAGFLNLITAFNIVYSVTPAALQRFDIVARASLSQTTILNLAMLIAVLLGYKLKVILCLNILAVIGQTIFLRRESKKLLPDINFGFGWDSEAIKFSYKFGLLAAVSNIANSFLTQLDRLIIPIFLDPASLTYYSLPGNVAQKTSGVIGSITGVLFPLTSSVAGSGQFERLKIIYFRFFRTATIFAASCTVAITVFSHQILEFWINRDLAEKGNTILVILASTYFLLSLLGPLTNFLLGLNKVKFIASVSLGMAFVNIILLVIFLPRMGILGAAWAYFGAATMVPFVFWWAEKKYLIITGQLKFYLDLYLKLIVTSVVFYFLMHYFVAPVIISRTILIIVGPLSVLFFIALYKLFGFFEPEDWDLFMLFLGKIKLKLK